MSKHTPGPWVVNKIAELNVQAESGFAIASTAVRSDNTVDQEALHEEQRANARLIAAAPDLLDALIQFVDVAETAPPLQFFQHLSDLVEPARAAIVKAKGKKR